MSKTIYNADYSECLPEALKKDPKMVALANATAAALLDASGIIDNVLIYSRFDELPEELVDILAYDLHVLVRLQLPTGSKTGFSEKQCQGS